MCWSVGTFGGLSYLKAHLPATHFHPTSTHGWGTTLVWGFIALATLVDPNFYQRAIAAKDERTARIGILISTFIWFCFDICTTLGGMYARAALPEAESSKAYFYYALQVLPSGMRGFVVAGILATILSTIDAFLFVAGTTISYDLMPEKWRSQKRVHIWGLVFVGILSIFAALAFENDIPRVWKTMGSYFSACLLFPIMLGYVFPKKISDNQFVIACVFALLMTTFWMLVKRTGIWAEVDPLYVGALSAAGALGVTALLGMGPSRPRVT